MSTDSYHGHCIVELTWPESHMHVDDALFSEVSTIWFSQMKIRNPTYTWTEMSVLLESCVKVIPTFCLFWGLLCDATIKTMPACHVDILTIVIECKQDQACVSQLEERLRFDHYYGTLRRTNRYFFCERDSVIHSA